MTSKVLQGDCMELLKTLPSSSYDIVVTDPPYSRNTITAHSRNGVRNLSDLSIQEFFYRELYKELERVLKPSGVVLTFCDDLFYPILFAASYNSLQSHSLIVWDKKQISFGNPIRKRHELIMYCSKGSGQFHRTTQRTHYPSIVEVQRDHVSIKEHDAQKPVALIRDLIEHFSPSDGSVLDPFVGSGSTLIAAQELGRVFTGIELSERYVAIAEKRLYQASQSLPLALPGNSVPKKGE